ncbi:MAG: hypothetical protein AAFX85_11685 [Pseudomonadota bacterium]
MKIYTRSLCLVLALVTVVAGLASHRELLAAPLQPEALVQLLPALPTLSREASPHPEDGRPLALQARVMARSKMSTRLASYAAAGDQRVMRLEVLLAPEAAMLDASRIAALGGKLLRMQEVPGRRVVDLPGHSLDRFALDSNVQRVSLVGIVAVSQSPATPPGQG